MSNSDILFEPRALWDVQRVTIDDITAPVVLAAFNKERFHNGGRWPITITRIALCPINYVLAAQDGVAPAGPTTWQNSMAAVFQQARVRINSPFRRHLSRRAMPIWQARTRRTWMQKPDAPAYASSLWGVSRLDFDHPLILPRLGTISCDITGYVIPSIGVPFGQPAGLGEDSVQSAMAIYEDGGQLNGGARVRPRSNLTPIVSTNQPWGNITDAFGNYGVITNTNAWPAAGMFPSRLFDAENAGRQGSSRVRGIGVHLDQINYDASQGAAVIAGLNTNPASPVSTRVGVRAVTSVGGSGEYWWRNGAPLALVFDTITPAIVYPLVEPITLPPGDALDVEIELPVQLFGGEVAPAYNLGVSFNGYAIIEG